jgi:hypothetical protein
MVFGYSYLGIYPILKILCPRYVANGVEKDDLFGTRMGGDENRIEIKVVAMIGSRKHIESFVTNHVTTP